MQDLITVNNSPNINWHDSRIYGIGFDGANYKLLFDVDIIIDWKKNANQEYYDVFLAPATLVFENVWDLSFDIETWNIVLDIENVRAINPKASKNHPDSLEYEWEMELMQGVIKFKALGFRVFFKDDPKNIPPQDRTVNDRGGISFNTSW